MKNIILVNGKKRAGKDYFARELKKKLESLDKTAEIMSFADPLKDIMGISLGVTFEELEDMKNAEKKVCYLEKPLSVDSYPQTIGMNNAREILQKFGTEGMKKYFGAAVWANLLKDLATKSSADYVIVPDFRFKVEQISDLTVKVANDNIKSEDTHASETELNDFKFSYVIDNTGYKSLDDQIHTFVKTGLGL